MKSKLKKIFRPVWRRLHSFRQWVQLLRIFVYDFRRFRRHYVSSPYRKMGREELEGWILQDKHRVEKAISLRTARVNFGRSVLVRLFENLKEYARLYPKNNVYYWGVGAFEAYKNFHFSRNVEPPAWFLLLYEKRDCEDIRHPWSKEVGVSPINSSTILPEEFEEFFSSRVSVRSFREDAFVKRRVLERIVNIAIKTPSVCNRQHWKVRVVSGELKNRVLELQNGNAGFGTSVPQVAIITSSLKAFYLPAERVQAFTDGGLFSMSFMLSCHALGVSTCALNWASSLSQDVDLRKLDILDSGEVVIMLVALGYAETGSVAANSPRKMTEDVLVIH